MWWARIRRREKLAAAREKLAAEEVIEKVESSIAGEEATTSQKPITEEVKVKAADNVAKTEEPTNAEKAEVQEEKGTAEKPTEPIEEMTAGKVDDVADEFCTILGKRKPNQQKLKRQNQDHFQTHHSRQLSITILSDTKIFQIDDHQAEAEAGNDDTIGEVEEALDVKFFNLKYYVINF